MGTMSSMKPHKGTLVWAVVAVVVIVVGYHVITRGKG